MPTTLTNFRLEDAEKARMEKAVAGLGINVSTILRRALAAFLQLDADAHAALDILRERTMPTPESAIIADDR